jgi:hypothetical protein
LTAGAGLAEYQQVKQNTGMVLAIYWGESLEGACMGEMVLFGFGQGEIVFQGGLYEIGNLLYDQIKQRVLDSTGCHIHSRVPANMVNSSQ